MNKQLIELLEDVVERAWDEQKMFGKAMFGKIPKRTESLCQGISRNVHGKVFGIFPNSGTVKFTVKDKSHVVVYVAIAPYKSYILDGTIRQFLPTEKRTVFLVPNYPFQDELKSAEKWF